MLDLDVFSCLLALAAIAAASVETPSVEALSIEAPRQEGWLEIDRGQGFDPVEIPRNERLVYTVVIDTIFGDLDVGTVTLISGTQPYNAGLPGAGGETPKSGPKDAPLEVGTIRSVAEGSYLGYTLHHELDVRHLPQPWPSSIYRDRQTGSENRQRELKLGVLDGKPTSIYRADGHCKGCSNPEHFVESAWIWGKSHHCEKCKRAEHRVWDAGVTRAVPPGTVDLLSAVYLARALVRGGGKSTAFPVLDKKRLWDLSVTRGDVKRIEVPSGTFRCSLVQLKTAVPAGEPADKDGFAGLFGIRGTIKIWMDAATGVPVLISGELPVPVIKDLDLYIKLKSYSGTPPDFVRAE